ncbi:MAG: DUF1467 family protein [Sphingomonadales bacterium]|nr:DUF1467 family protein [Sphingomonadales bacterium]
MRWTSVLAIYFLIWSVMVFCVLPFGIRTHGELGHDLVPGQSEGAPGNYRPRKVALITSLLSALVMLLFWFAVSRHWITHARIAWLFPAPRVL